jgi:hypothetical protein
MAMQESRVIEVLYTSELGFYTDCPIPALLRVNRESRFHALEQYKLLVLDNERLSVIDSGGYGLYGDRAIAAHKPQPNSANNIVPFGTYVNYDRDDIYLSLGGVSGSQTVNLQRMYSFLHALLEDPLSKVQRVIFDSLFVHWDSHFVSRLLAAFPPLDNVLLALSDNGVSYKPRDYAAPYPDVRTLHPCPRRIVAGMQQSKDTKQISRWDPVEAKDSPVPLPNPDNMTWEQYMTKRMDLYREHFIKYPANHSDGEKGLWEKLKFSFVNIIRAPAAATSN